MNKKNLRELNRKIALRWAAAFSEHGQVLYVALAPKLGGGSVGITSSVPYTPANRKVTIDLLRSVANRLEEGNITFDEQASGGLVEAMEAPALPVDP